MSKASQEITERIDAALAAGTVPWSMPWIAGSGASKNLDSKRAYTGINVLLLALSAHPGEWWVTYKQALKLGGNVRKGEHGTRIFFWSEYCPVAKKVVRYGQCGIEGHTRRDHPMLQKAYKVFNAEAQCDGLERRIPPRRHHPVDNDGALAIGLRLVDALRNYDLREATEEHPLQDGAWYAPTMDIVNLPATRRFVDGRRYYWAALHELVHSTGHEDRLNRPSDHVFGSKEYAREELVAEIGSAIAARTLGFEPDIEQSAAYIEHWRDKIAEDGDLILWAAQRATKAVDLLFSEEETK